MMIEPSAVSFNTTTSWVTAAGSMANTACGTSICIRDWVSVSPSASDASRWPLGRLPTPERTSSATTDPLYSTSANTTAQYDELPMPRNANPRQKKIIISSTGTARQNSTTTAETPRSSGFGSSRPMPKTRPNATAPMTARIDAWSVIHRPGR